MRLKRRRFLSGQLPINAPRFLKRRQTRTGVEFVRWFARYTVDRSIVDSFGQIGILRDSDARSEP